jgi:glucose/arabinose dehydrogenase
VIAPAATAILALAASGQSNDERRSMRAPFLFLCVVALVGCGEGEGTATPTPLDLRLELVVEGLVAPVFATAPEGDSRLFIVERSGRIRIVANAALVPEPFLDIRSRVNFLGERGMLSMAFHPQYATNGRFFVYYVDLQGDIAIERFTSTPGSNVAGASEGIVLGIPHGGSEHHGGLAAFGPDGMLYLATGDGRCCGDPDDNAQNLNSLLGKILRIDVATFPYTIPPDNPYVAMMSARPAAPRRRGAGRARGNQHGAAECRGPQLRLAVHGRQHVLPADNKLQSERNVDVSRTPVRTHDGMLGHRWLCLSRQCDP